jgi:hypothetical protein
LVCYSTLSVIYSDLTLLSQIDPGSDLTSFQQNPSKTIAPLVNQKATQHTGCTAQSHPR